MATKPKAGAGDPARNKRSEIVSVRLDPKLKYLAELAARKQRRSLSGYIEWMLEDSLKRVVVTERDQSNNHHQETLSEAERDYSLWEVDEADRVVKLAIHFPELLTFEEQLIWRLVRENGLVWRGTYRNGEFTWTLHQNAVVWETLRRYWPVFKQVAAGELDDSHLPKWAKTPPKGHVPEKEPDPDDDIPF